MNAPPSPRDEPVEELLETGWTRRITITVPWLVVAVLAAGLAGFFVRGHYGRSPATVIVTSPRATVVVTAPPATDSTAGPPFTYLSTTDSTCSAQLGHRLQLGAEVQNLGDTDVVLVSVTPVFPLKGLRAVATRRGTCGQPVPGSIANYPIGPGFSVWITTTVEVLVPCPAALPVFFAVTYRSAGTEGRFQLTGFADLGTVPYTGCRH